MLRGALWQVSTVLFSAVAGCASPSNDSLEPPTSAGTTTSDQGSTPPPISDPVHPVQKPTTIQWTNCFGAGAFSYGPNALSAPTVPDGWQFSWPINELYYTMFHCERMSIGPFERGPVRGVIEDFSAIDPPSACAEGDYTQSSMIANWWLDDAEIASLLGSLGIPIHYVVISVEPTTVTDAGIHVWRWGTGSQESWMAFETNQALSDGFRRIQRMFWPAENMTAIGVMDLDMRQEFDVATTAIGHLSPPSLYAFAGAPAPFVGASGAVLSELELSATLQYFGDLQCEEPSP
jgi:hypothetical protein